jgi:hypothetical protein
MSATIFIKRPDCLSRFELLELCEPRRDIPYSQHVTWRQRAGVLVTCQNSDLVKREEPARPPSPHPLHRSTCHWLAFTMRMMLQRDAVHLLHHASSRCYVSREELLAIISRGKVNPGLTLHSIVSAPVLLLVTCGYYYVHRCSQEINITRGFHPQGANLVSRSGLSQCSDTEPDQETATEMSFRPLGSIPCGILTLLNIQIITLL